MVRSFEPPWPTRHPQLAGSRGAQVPSMHCSPTSHVSLDVQGRPLAERGVHVPVLEPDGVEQMLARQTTGAPSMSPHAAPDSANTLARQREVVESQKSPCRASQGFVSGSQASPAVAPGAQAPAAQTFGSRHGCVASHASPFSDGTTQVPEAQRNPSAQRPSPHGSPATGRWVHTPHAAFPVTEQWPPSHCQSSPQAAPSATEPFGMHAAGIWEPSS